MVKDEVFVSIIQKQNEVNERLALNLEKIEQHTATLNDALIRHDAEVKGDIGILGVKLDTQSKYLLYLVVVLIGALVGLRVLGFV